MRMNKILVRNILSDNNLLLESAVSTYLRKREFALNDWYAHQPEVYNLIKFNRDWNPVLDDSLFKLPSLAS